MNNNQTIRELIDEDAVFAALKEIGREGHYCC